jgi:hypothetical protein
VPALAEIDEAMVFHPETSGLLPLLTSPPLAPMGTTPGQQPNPLPNGSSPPPGAPPFPIPAQPR